MNFMNKKHPRIHSQPSKKKTLQLIRPALSERHLLVKSTLPGHMEGSPSHFFSRFEVDLVFVEDFGEPQTKSGVNIWHNQPQQFFENCHYILSIKFDPCPKRVPFNDPCFTTKTFYNNLGRVLRTPYNPTKQRVGGDLQRYLVCFETSSWRLFFYRLLTYRLQEDIFSILEQFN